MYALQDHGFRIDRPGISRIFAGKQLPDPKMRAALEDIFGVGWRLWDEAADSPESGEHPAAASDATGTGDS